MSDEEQTPEQLPEGIAVIGLAGRFPGAADTDELWRNLRDGVESITRWSREELAAAGVDPALLEHPQYVRAAGLLPGIELFDAPFFGFSPREAELMDPQQRLFLEQAWAALENAGYDTESYSGSIGIFGGMGMSNYLLNNLLSHPGLLAAAGPLQVRIFNDKDFLVSLTAFKLNLTGPSVNVQTACSTSLVATCLACQSLLAYQCDIALAGGVTLAVPQTAGYMAFESVMSPSGVCRAFDADADGTVGGSGAGLVVLKRLADALADGDTIHAVIKGFATNNDGSFKMGYTAPGVDGQIEVIAMAQAVAGIKGDSIGYVETHGTGTPLGDPVEVEALTEVFRTATDQTNSCALGSIKTNIGHLDTAAGVASLIKTVLALENRILPPSLNFARPNPQIDFASSPFYVNTEARPWIANGVPRRAGVSSFAIGGVNTHVVLEEAPAADPGDPAPLFVLLPLSARSETALERRTDDLVRHLREHPEMTAEDFADAAFTLQVGRRAFRHRRALVCRDRADALACLEGRDPRRLLGGVGDAREARLAFLFPGLGNHHVGMARGLYRAEPRFRATVDDCAERLIPELGVDLREALWPEGPPSPGGGEGMGEGPGVRGVDLRALLGRGATASPAEEEAARRLARTELAQPAVFVIEIALARLLMDLGLQPDALLGFSIGEYVAACLAGVMELPDALRLVTRRARLIGALPEGSMLAVPLAEADALRLSGGDLSVAAVIGPSLSVLAGPEPAIAEIERRLTAEGNVCRRLQTTHAFHSRMMEPALARFRDLFRGVVLRAPEIPFVSNVTGTWITAEQAQSPAYWADHMRQAVRFGDGLAALWQEPGRALLEVGPGQTLASWALQHPAASKDTVIVPTMRHAFDHQDDSAFLLTALGRLWLAGIRLDWAGLWGDQRRRRVPLPAYPFERQRYWVEPAHRGTSVLEMPQLPEAIATSAPPLPARAPGVVHARPEIGVAYAEPRSETERTIAWMWREMLGLDRVGVHDSFFDLGGDSLLATRLVSRLNETFGIGLTLRAIFEAPAVADLALVVAAARGGGEAPPVHREIPKRSWDGPRPLSFAQRRLWFLDQLEPGNPFYNTPAASELHGPVDPSLLARAFTEIVRRHETLRASFGSVDGEPFLTIAAPGPWTLPLIDLSALPAAPASAEMMGLARREAQTPFDLGTGPLLRTALVRLDPADHALFVTMHHIISDGWSNNVFLGEMVALYEAYAAGRTSPLPELPIQYADFAAWQIEQLAEGILADQLAYWRQRLAGLPPSLDLPTDRPRPAVQTFRGARLTTVIPDDLTARLRHLGREEGGTLFMALFSALATFLYRHTGQEDFAVGVPVANRTRRETEGLIGFFTNTLVVRTAPAGRATFRELLHAVRATTQEAFVHQDLPFEKLVEELQPQRDLSRSPFFQVMLVSTALDQSTVEGFAWQRLDIDPEVARFDLLFDLSEMGDRLNGVLEYSTDLFDVSTAQRFESRLRTLLEEAAAGPDRALSDLPLLSAEERAQILQEWSTLPPAPGAGRLVHLRVSEQAARTPDATALIGFDGAELSYRELEERSNRLARRLRRLGVGPEVRVALGLERSPELLVTLLAILKAGGAYVPLDPGYPEEWRAVMLGDSGARVVDWSALDLSGESAEPLPETLDLDNIAYVLYTSGSTGRPKGVTMVHRALANLVDWQIETMPGMSEMRRTLQLTSLNFDVSFQEIFATWAAGGALVLISEDDRRDPAALLATLRERQVERIFLPFVALQQLAEVASLEERLPERLREVVTAGEQLRVTPALVDLFRRLPGARLHNHYGPTETHVVTAHTLQGDPAAWPPLPPIGRSLSGVGVDVLDRDGGTAPVGVAGELMLGGVCLARGYLGRPDLTAERFVPDAFAGLRGEPGARLYRTGDRARWLPDGTIELFGRLDDQVKIRGYRVEPGEIEAALGTHPGVAAAAVGVVQHGDPGRDDRRLVAWVVAKEDREKPSDLRAYLAGRLPEHEVPSAVVFVDAMPLTPSGKVDRRHLASLGLDLGPAAVETTAPRNASEELLAGIWAEVLGLPRVGVHDNFFALGGHSLLATRVVSRVRAGLGVALPVRALFEAPTVAALAARLDAQRHSEAVAALPPIVPVPRTGPLPLSWSQERIWFLERLQPGLPTYNLPLAVDLRGPLHTAALAATLSEIVRRHEALRTVFHEIDWKPVQEVLPARPLDLPVIELEALPEEVRAAEAERQAVLWVRSPFDLRQGPLLAPALLRLAPDHHRLILSMHHIASDGWSIGLLVREISALYPRLAGLPGGEPLPELPVQYADFAVWQRGWLHGEALDRLVAAWRVRLDGAPPSLDLPADRPRPAQQTFAGANALFAFDAEPTAALAALAQAEGATLFMVLLAAWQSLLQRLSGQDDLVVGTPVAGRNRPETEDLIGVFINTLALRGDLSGNPTFRELVRRSRETALEAYALQDLPFEKLVEELHPVRDLSRPPIVQVMLVLQNAPLGPLTLPGLTLEPLGVESGTAKFDLLLALDERESGLTGALEHNTALFDTATAERLLRCFRVLLRAAAADPGRRLASLPLLTETEIDQLVQGWNQTAADFAGPSVPEQIAEQARRDPDAVAVVFEGESLTRGELDARAESLAGHLRTLGAGPETLVAIAIERSLELMLALLAVWKAEAAYLPIDPEDPRSAAVLAAASPVAVLTKEGVQDVLACPPSPGERVGGAGRGAGGEGLAYVIYTSGSTGTPKGAMAHHHGLRNRLLWGQQTFHLTPNDTVLQKTPITFDVSVWELFWPLISGARLVLAKPGGHRDPQYLIDLIARERVTVTHFVPSMLRAFLDDPTLQPEACRSLRLVIASGEALTPDLVRRFYARVSGAELHNLYGPTETSIEVTAWPCKPADADGPVPIGFPIANTRLQILDPEGQPVPVGVPGELMIGGVPVGRGYLGRPDLTAERFMPDPFPAAGETGARLYRSGDLARRRPDGAVEYLGRIDQQVKVRGVRIELGEIEAALGSHPTVREAAVIVRQDAAGPNLVACLVAATGREVDPTELRSFLRQTLPEPMIPAAFAVLPSLPLTRSGKVDRRRLAVLSAETRDEEAAASAAPRTHTEKLLARIWCEILGVPRVGVHDSFFALGGHSLLATRVTWRVRAAFGVTLPVRALFEAPTVATLAASIDAARPLRTAEAPTIVPTGVTEAPLSFAQERLWFLDQLTPGNASYNMPAVLRLTGDLDVAALQHSFTEIVRRQAVLRTTFAKRDGAPRQVIAPAASVPLPVLDLSALPELRREEEAARLVAAEVGRPFDLEHGPVLRLHLLRNGRNDHTLIAVVHHIASDGWSMGVLVRECAALYQAFAQGQPSPLPELPVQYATYALWQRSWLTGPVLQEQLDFWRNELAGAPALLELPTDRPRPAMQSTRGATIGFVLPTGAAEAVQTLSRQAGATPFMVLLTAFQTLLHRWSGMDDILVGSPVANRGRADIEGLIGMFINTLVFRLSIREGESFLAALDRVRTATLAGHDHQDLPFERLVDVLEVERSLAHTPLFQTMLVLQNAPVGALEIPGLTFTPVSWASTTSKFDLTLSLAETPDGIAGSLEYATDLFDRTTIERFLGHFGNLLASAGADPGFPLADLRLLDAAEERLLLTDLNRTERTWARPAAVHALIAEQAQRTPDHTAAAGPAGALTYRELDAQADALALRIQAALGDTLDQRIGLLADPDPQVLVGMLGILKSGAGFVPIDPRYPDDRIAWMLEDSACPVLVTQKRHQARAQALTAGRILCLEEDEEIGPIRRIRPIGPIPSSLARSLSYIVYTSGSTGRPKGVQISHENLVPMLLWVCDYLGLSEHTRVLQSLSFSFDFGIFEHLTTVLAGGTLFFGAAGADPAAFGREIARLRINTLHTTPAFARELAAVSEHCGDLHSLEIVHLGGEALSRTTVDRIREAAPNATVYNGYGPTEATINSSIYQISDETSVWPVVPIGQRSADNTLYVLDGGGRLVPFGVRGELHVGGIGVARGYLNRPDLTAERFIPDPFGTEPGGRLYRTGDLVRYLPGGAIDFLGRIDQQVKLRGFRIELGEIEAALGSHPEVREAAVVLRQDAAGPNLVACIVPAAGREPEPGELRSFLRQTLPEPMIPAAFVTLPALPLTRSGKVDRRALAQAGAEAAAARAAKPHVAPQTPLEEWLVTLVADLLRLDRVGINDNFFDLGGHSLLATQLLARLQKDWAVELPLRDLFAAADLAALAESITERELAAAAESGELDEALAELGELSPEELNALLSGEA